MTRLRNLRLGEPLRRALVPVLAIITAFIVGAIVIVLTDYEHLKNFGTDPAGSLGGAIELVVRGYGAMFAGAVVDPARVLAALQSGTERDIATAIWPISEALVSATPLIFVALGAAVAFHAGLLNLGGDGQFFMGAFGAGLTTALVAGLVPPPLVLVLGIAGGTLAGAAYGFVPGFLKARTGAHEVITTLMLNAIAPGLPFLVGGLVASLGLFSGPPGPIPTLPRLVEMETIRVDVGIIAALGVSAVVSFLLFRTTLGFELRAAGFNRTAARSGGMRPGRSTMLAMSISGGLAGMGSAFLALGPGLPGEVGLVGLALALLAGLRPSAIVLVALLYGALNNGAKQMVIETRIPLSLLTVVIALAVMFVAAPRLIGSIWRVRVAAPETDGVTVAPIGRDATPTTDSR